MGISQTKEGTQGQSHAQPNVPVSKRKGEMDDEAAVTQDYENEGASSKSTVTSASPGQTQIAENAPDSTQHAQKDEAVNLNRQLPQKSQLNPTLKLEAPGTPELEDMTTATTPQDIHHPQSGSTLPSDASPNLSMTNLVYCINKPPSKQVQHPRHGVHLPHRTATTNTAPTVSSITHLSNSPLESREQSDALPLKRTRPIAPANVVYGARYPPPRQAASYATPKKLRYPHSATTQSVSHSSVTPAMVQTPVSEGARSAYDPQDNAGGAAVSVTPSGLGTDGKGPSAVGRRSGEPKTENKKEKLKSIIGKSGRGSYNCRLCKRSFRYESSYSSHIRTHSEDRPFACDICPSKFKTKSDFNRHRRVVHEKLRPHACQTCDATFPERGKLLRHIATVHDNKRPHVCPVCGACFGERGNLKQHCAAKHS